jgi:DNA repair photolyase
MEFLKRRSRMSVIYEPAGKAREYSPLACNLYEGCNHGCLYCYAPGIRRMLRSQYLEPKPRKGIVENFRKECHGIEKPILFCFMTDPYNKVEEREQLTRQCLEIAEKQGAKIKILTKSDLVLRDLDLFEKMKGRIRVGMTLTFFDEAKSKTWEPGAISPEARIKTLKTLHDKGVRTWASFEPVIEPEESLMMMEAVKNCVDEWKIGKLNNFQGLDKKIDWNDFLKRALDIVRPTGSQIYIKVDLREAADRVQLKKEETITE